MTPCQTELLSIIATSREDLVRETTHATFSAGDSPMPREGVEQLIRACLALLEEALQGTSDVVRRGFLEAMPDLARTSTLPQTMKSGLPCWVVIVGKLSVATSAAHRDEAMAFLSQFIGLWWSDVVTVMQPVWRGEGGL